MWLLFCEEVKPENLRRLKDIEFTFSFKAGDPDIKFADNHPFVLRCKADPILMEHESSIARNACENGDSYQDLISRIETMPNLEEIEIQHNARITMMDNRGPNYDEPRDFDMLSKNPHRVGDDLSKLCS
jgi:hypothetical protein